MSMAKQGAKTVVPRLRFPEFRGKFGWSEKILGEEGDFLSPLTGKTAQHFGTGTAKYVTYMNVFANAFTDMGGLGIVDVESDELQNAIQAGDVLFTVSSETPEEVGMSSVVIDAVPNCYVNSFCAMFRFADGKQPNLHFLGYSLRQPLSRYHFVKRAQGSTRFNLSKAAFRALPLAIPSPAEQQKIAACLTSLDEVIAAQGRKVEALKAHKRGLMQQLFPREGETRPRLRFPEFRDAPEWEPMPLGDAFLRITNGKANAQDHEVGGAYPLFDRSEVVKASNTSAFAAEAVILPGEGVAFRPRYFKGEFNLHQRAYALMECQGHAKYFLYALDHAKGDLALKAVKSTVLSLRLPIIEKFVVNTPEKQEQQRIADCLSYLDTQITAETHQLAALKTHKQGLMQQLFPVPEAASA